MNVTKVVQYPNVARKLVRDGYKIVDLKPKKENRSQTLYVFEVSEGFEDVFNEYMKDFSKKKEV